MGILGRVCETQRRRRNIYIYKYREGDVDRTQWKDDFIAWLEEFPWQWFCSLTFRPGLNEAQAR